MANNLVCRTEDLMPTVAERSHDLTGIPETWGLPVWLPRSRVALEPPMAHVLEAMQDELATALVPAGPELAAKYALILNESYPMRDVAGVQYADRIIERLADCPPDLLQKVCDDLLNSSPHRPAVSEVKAAVSRHLSARRYLLLRVQAGLRYWAWLAMEDAQARDTLAAAVLSAETDRVVRSMRAKAPRRSAPLEPPGNAMSAEPSYSKVDLRAQETIRQARMPAKSQ